ncbi:hypothetical protein B0I72DRAFT_172085 [Yarrowia lipolytica]|jgi:hypothetical protein|nr:Hypothetical protein YALI2_C00322g [Yarrowia lipolytica]RDW35130.1 hypothetical protein B0I72DRAFT_172085 [Yarrowia lipolytica]RDW37955.1 hypothetical protein B0I73DRAFT_162518 [Yarrowia lipolytica]RDW46871.1 hypothetical protein B0I74DRAFT_151790 [Yarrowia lipolytica]RDW54272.1 hypothetical protein B0I75DRAFT_100636 [Yarrowia lipolytica]
MLFTNLVLAALAVAAPVAQTADSTADISKQPKYKYPESDFYFNLISDDGQVTVNSSGLTLGYTGKDTSASGNEFHIDDDGFLNYNNKEYVYSGHIAFDHTNKAVLVPGKGNPDNKSDSSPFSVNDAFGKNLLAFDSYPVAWGCPGFNGTYDIYRYGCGSNCPKNEKGDDKGIAKPLFVNELPGYSYRRPFALESQDMLQLAVVDDGIEAQHGNFSKWNLAYNGQLVELGSSRFVKVDDQGKFTLTAPNDIGAASTGFMKVGDKLMYNTNDGFHLETIGDQLYSVYADGDDHLKIVEILRH